MKKFIEGGNIEAGYTSDETHGIFIDSNGNESQGTPGIVRHDAEWAEISVEVCGGYMVFDSVTEYNVWKKQI